MRSQSGGLVYSTDQGRLCPDCQQPIASCLCRESRKNEIPKSDGIVRVSRETKGRKGKGVTLIKGLPLPVEELKKLAKQLKQHCGTGGSVKDSVIEIQGDQRTVLVAELTHRGYKVKKVGA